MGWILTSSVATVVAASAITCDVHVVEIGWQPADCGMTIVAVVATVYMRWMLAGRDYAVMTCATVSHHLGMVHGEVGTHTFDVWQSSQTSLVCIWVTGFPAASTPL